VTLGYSIHPEATDELSAAIARYELGNVGSAPAFEAAVEDLVGRLPQWPGSGGKHRVQVPGVVVRQGRIARSPFWVVYFVEDGTLTVVAVAHERRKPGYWKDRVCRHDDRGAREQALEPIRTDLIGDPALLGVAPVWIRS
jgi:toxin ParE1/3/4